MFQKSRTERTRYAAAPRAAMKGESMNKNWFPALLILCCLLVLPLLGAQAEPEGQGYRSQTIMVYIIGSDLESDTGMATADILEMLKARPDKERLNVLVMTGGTDKWMSRTIPRDKLSVFKIEGMNPRLLHQWDSASMGEPETLRAFLDWSRSNHPADSYGLILWDHGGGPLVGFGVDTAYRGDGLTLFELKDALAASPFGGEEQLEWLAFDACLMASLEVAALTAGHVRYLVASQEVLPGYGFDYGFLKDLGGTGLTGPEVARAIIDRTYSFYKNLAEKNPEALFPVTLSLLDLGKAQAAQAALDGMFADLDRGLQAGIYSDIARNRDLTKDYGRTRTTNTFDLIDLVDLSRNLAGLYPEKAGRLQSAARDMVLYNRSNAPRTNGVSIYFPLRNKEMYKQMWGGLYQQFDIAPAYKAFMGRFGDILLSDSLSQWTGGDTPAVSFDEETGEYYIQLSPEQVKNYDRGEYYVLARQKGEEFTLYYMSSDVTLDGENRLRANFNGKTMLLEDPTRENSLIPYMLEKENIQGVGSYQIPVVLARTDSEGGTESLRAELMAEIDKGRGEARITGAIRDDGEGGFFGKRDLDLDAWDNVFLIYNSFFLTRGADGAVLPLGDWVSSDLPRVVSFSAKGGLGVRYGAFDESLLDAFVMISIVDTQGYVYSSELMPLAARPGESPEPFERPQATTVEFMPGTAQPVLLTQEQGIRVSLAGIGQEAGELLMHFLLESSLQAETVVATDWVQVNGFMADALASAAVQPGGQVLMTLGIPLDGPPFAPGLQELGVRRAEDIRLRFELSFSRSDFFRQTLSDEIRILTDLPLQPLEQVKPRLEEGMLLLEDGGVSIHKAGDWAVLDEVLHIPLRITNRSDTYDLVRLAESAVNGIMAPMTMQEDVPPGAVLYAQAKIPLKRTVLPPELAEYQHLFDGLDNLQALGISQARDVTLRFALEVKGVDGFPVRLTAPLTLTDPGMAGFLQTLDTAGEELYQAEGVSVVRLSSDPRGEIFLVRNTGPRTIHIATFGHVKADGEYYADNMPLNITVSPGAAGYAKLFGYLPGIKPDARELTFYINAIDLEENSLLARSDKITLLFPGE